MVKAANEGHTLVELAPREGITQDFAVLADRLLGRDVAAPAKAGFKLFGRAMAARA
jgi:Flp pilus assembly CpaE family ATPase